MYKALWRKHLLVIGNRVSLEYYITYHSFQRQFEAFPELSAALTGFLEPSLIYFSVVLECACWDSLVAFCYCKALALLQTLSVDKNQIHNCDLVKVTESSEQTFQISPAAN